VLEVDFEVLEEFILDETGQSYDMVSGEEWGNDSQHQMIIDGKLDYEKPAWESFKTKGMHRSYLLRIILDGLCSEGKIPAGTYLITVCW